MRNKEEQYDSRGRPNNSKETDGGKVTRQLRSMNVQGGGHKVRDDIKREIRGRLDVRHAKKGELTPGKKQGGSASKTITMVS